MMKLYCLQRYELNKYNTIYNIKQFYSFMYSIHDDSLIMNAKVLIDFASDADNENVCPLSKFEALKNKFETFQKFWKNRSHDALNRFGK